MKFRPLLLVGLLACGLSLSACSSNADGTAAEADSSSDNSVETVAASETGSPTDTTPVDGSADATNSTSDTTPDTSPVAAVTSISEQPGASDDDFVGAAKDVTLKSCKLNGSKWVAEGTVTNESGADANYRIYVALNAPGTTDTKALVQANVEVADGKTESWSAEADIATADLTCILRVERAAS